MQFQVGESVSMLHESGAYTIQQLSDSHAHVLDEFGFEYRIPISSLIKRTPIKGEVENKELLVTPNATKKQALSSIPTLDLHATALGIDGMPPNELLETKLSYCRSFINQCIANRQSFRWTKSKRPFRSCSTSSFFRLYGTCDKANKLFLSQ